MVPRSLSRGASPFEDLVDSHVVVVRQRNRGRPKLAHHLMGAKMDVYRCPIRQTPFESLVRMDRIGLGTTIVYGWPSDLTLKVTTVAYDHGCEENFSQKLK